MPPVASDEKIELAAFKLVQHARDAAVAEAGTIDESGIADLELPRGLLAGGRKALAPPDLIEALRVAAVALGKILAPDAKPAPDPDLDGIGLGQRSLTSRHIGRVTFDCDWHVRT